MNVDSLENSKNDERTSKQQRPTNTPRGAIKQNIGDLTLFSKEEEIDFMIKYCCIS